MCPMNIVIFEHDPAFRQYLETFICQQFHEPPTFCTGSLTDVSRYVMQNRQPTLFFLDIVFENEQDRTHGFTVAKLIKEQRLDDLLVFVTAYRNRIEGNTFFQVSAFNTIYKPVRQNDWSKINGQLGATIDLAKDYFDKQCLVLNDRDDDLFIRMRNICFIQKIKGERRIQIHSTDGQYMMRSWLKEVKELLDERFIYASRFTIVNVDAVTRIDKRNKRLIFSDGSNCPYGREYTNSQSLQGWLALRFSYFDKKWYGNF